MNIRPRFEWRQFAASEPFGSPTDCVQDIGLLLGHLQHKVGVFDQCPEALLDKVRAAVRVGNEGPASKAERIGLRAFIRRATTPDTAADIGGFASKWRHKFPSRRLTLTEWQLLQVVTPMFVEALTASDDRAADLEAAIRVVLALWAEERLQGS